MDSLYDIRWNFSNLENAFEKVGLLSGKKVYLFGCTEPQLVMHKLENKVICIPVVVAVVSPFPPSDKIGISFIQREAEEIIPMKQMKMDWVPYIPLEDRYFSQLVYVFTFSGSFGIVLYETMLLGHLSTF